MRSLTAGKAERFAHNRPFELKPRFGATDKLSAGGSSIKGTCQSNQTPRGPRNLCCTSEYVDPVECGVIKLTNETCTVRYVTWTVEFQHARIQLWTTRLVFNGAPCPDPYTYSCATLTGLDVRCREIGWMLIWLDTNGNLSYRNNLLYGWHPKEGACINAYGVTRTTFSSATTETYAPVETPASNTAGSGVVFSPEDAWTAALSNESCSKIQSFYTTSHIGATVTFNYTGE